MGLPEPARADGLRDSAFDAEAAGIRRIPVMGSDLGTGRHPGRAFPSNGIEQLFEKRDALGAAGDPVVNGEREQAAEAMQRAPFRQPVR